MNDRELIKALTPMYGAGEARAIVRLVLEERFGLSQTDLLLGKGTHLLEENRTEWEKITAELLQGTPVQYVLGFVDFCGRRLRVSPAVLIPRPETEELVARASGFLSNDTAPRILDLCTGSGCIALSLAMSFPASQVVGVDVSEDALEVARMNGTLLGATNCAFISLDVLQAMQEDFLFGASVPCYSLLTANPPYVCDSEATEMHAVVVEHEPSLALFVPDSDPLRFYDAIARLGRSLLLPDAPVVVEINAALGAQTSALFSSYGYHSVQVHTDQFGRARVLCALNGKVR